MAMLSPEQRTEIRQVLYREFPSSVLWSKAQANLAIQAVEDWFEANRPSLVVAINTATSPFVFTNPQKALIVKHWLDQKFRRGG